MLPFNILTYRQLARMLVPLFPEPLGDAGQMKSTHARSPAGSPGSFGSCSPAPERAPSGTAHRSPLTVVLGILLAAAMPAPGQVPTPFLPLLSGPVPSDYKLGPGDQLVLILTGEVELAYTLQVTREGFILIPQVGQLYVSNLSLDHLRDVLYTRLGRVYSGVRRSANATTRSDISFANVRASQVYVGGEGEQPGAYQISSLGRVLVALGGEGAVPRGGHDGLGPD